MIEALAAHRANDALDVGVLPRRARCRDDLLDSHCLEAIAEDLTIRCVTVPQQISRCCVPREGLGHLMREPDLGWVLSDIEVNDPSAVVAEDDHGVEQPTGRGRNNEHVDGRRLTHVVAQETAPARGRDCGSPGHVSADGGLAHYDTELEQLAVDPGRTPQRIGDAHFADQISGLYGRLGPSLTAGS